MKKETNKKPNFIKELIEEASGLPAEYRKWIKLGIFSSLSVIFVTVAIILIVSFLIIWFLPR